MVDTNKIKMDESWKEKLIDEFNKDYMSSLKKFLKSEYDKKKIIYPPAPLYFEALNKTPYDKVKVVILGQDPYHGPNQAHGLCFSVTPEVKPPPSLVNIFKELKSDLGIETPKNGCLTGWAEQGVLLLNATLTVEHSKAGSHQKKGWEEFTDQILKKVNEKKEPVVFILWGSFAQKKGAFIDDKKHLVIKSPHPSPLSSYRGFFGSRPFSKTNDFLKENKKKVIDWKRTYKF